MYLKRMNLLKTNASSTKHKLMMNALYQWTKIKDLKRPQIMQMVPVGLEPRMKNNPKAKEGICIQVTVAFDTLQSTTLVDRKSRKELATQPPLPVHDLIVFEKFPFRKNARWVICGNVNQRRLPAKS